MHDNQELLFYLLVPTKVTLCVVVEAKPVHLCTTNVIIMVRAQEYV